MRKSLLAALVFLTFPSPAQEVYTAHPLFSERNALLEPRAEGTWLTQFWGPYEAEFTKTGDNFYRVRLTTVEKSTLYEGVFTKPGETLMLDLRPVLSDSLGDDTFRKHLLSLHSLYRVNIQNDTLRLEAVSYSWFYDSLAARGPSSGYIWSGSGIVLTSETSQLRTFVADHARSPKFFSEALVFHRTSNPTVGAPLDAQTTLQREGEPEDFSGTQKRCVPVFPYRDGWYGGDGDISIPISRNSSLWIFGDSFVGMRDQSSRSGTRMISNSLAVSSCEGDSSHIRYYWQDQYTGQPSPFFKSYTSRYRYWPAGVFSRGKTVYVVLQKIGPPEGATRPNEIFGWTNAGMSLAKITGAGATTPDRWTIELLPWSDTFDPNTWNGYLARKGPYIYMFPAGKDRTVHLLRLPLAHVESPRGFVEYYANDGQWKPGTTGPDMKTVLEGEAGQSVEYHADRGLWVMVCGPGFLTNKIRIRTARELAGPWSEEKVVYECPETTPGSPRYDKSNFCYLGREHLQYYDGATMVITYDCNSTDFIKLATNPGIYSPRVLKIPLPH